MRAAETVVLTILVVRAATAAMACAEPFGAAAFPVVIWIEAGFGIDAATGIVSPQLKYRIAAAAHRAAGRIVSGQATASFLRGEAGE